MRKFSNDGDDSPPIGQRYGLSLFSRSTERTSLAQRFADSSKSLERSRKQQQANNEYLGFGRNAKAPSRSMICNFLLRPGSPQIAKNSTVDSIRSDDDDWFSANFPKISSSTREPVPPPSSSWSSLMEKNSPPFAAKKRDDPMEFFETPLNYIVTGDNELLREKITKETKGRSSERRKKIIFYCLICRMEISGKECVREHVSGKRHNNSRKKYGCDDITMENNGEYCCKCCDRRFGNFTILHGHLESNEHAECLTRSRNKNGEKNDEILTKNCEDSGENMFCENMTTFCEKTTPFCEKTTPFCEKTTPFCQKTTPFCETTPSRETTTPSREITTPSCESTTPSCQSTTIPAQITSCIFVAKRNAKKSFCQICDNSQLPISTKKIIEHINGQRHTIALKRYGCDNIVTRENGDYHCDCCSRVITDIENVYLHIRDKKHMSSLIKVNQESNDTRKISTRTRIIDETYEPPLKPLLSDYIDVKMQRDACAKSLRTGVPTMTDVYRPDYISKRTGMFFTRNNINEHQQQQRKDIDKQKDNIQQPELSSILTSMSDEVSRLFKQIEENRKTRFADKSRANGTIKNINNDERIKNLDNNVAEYTRKIFCPICQLDVSDLTQLHSHMAQHFSDEFAQTRKHPLRYRENLLIDDNNSNNRVTREINASRLNVDFCQINGTPTCDDSEILDSTKLSTSNELISNVTEHFETVSQDETNKTFGSVTRDYGTLESEEEDSLSPMINNETFDSMFDENLSFSEEMTMEKLPKNTSRMRKKTTLSARKIDLKRIMQTLDFDKDSIYDMTEKLGEMKLGLKLCLIIDSRTIYCLICRKTVNNKLQDYFDHLWSIDHCEYLEIMERDNTRFALTPDQFSDLDLAQEYMQETSEKYVRCLICDRDIANNDRSLIEHIYDKIHERTCEQMRSNALANYEDMKGRLSCDWYGVQKYWCVPCFANMESEVSFVRHLEGQRHANNIRKTENYGKTMILDYCQWCALLWYGYRSTYNYHKDIPYHKWLVRDGHFAIGDLPIFAKSLLAEPEKYASERINYLDSIASQESAKVEILVDDIEKVARMKFPRAKAHTFGSRVSGLGSEDSDIDVFLDCHNMYDGRESTESQVLYFINGVHQCLSKDPESWDVEELLTKCRSPIIRAFHRATGLACDISFENGLAVENTKLIRNFNSIYPSCRKLILVLKQWLAYCDLSGSERITSYALYWFVIFYLQKESILPSVATLIKMRKKSQIIAGWETGVSKDFTYWEPDGILSIGELLKRFFTFYSSFDFRFDVACPLLGETIKKRDFAESWSLPEEMRPYQLYMKRSNTDPEPFRIDSPMCIQDPYDLQHNITKAVSKAYLNRFRTCCTKSLDLLASA